MRLEEKHKEFVVQGYACFMSRTEIVDAFMEKFSDEIYNLCADDTPIYDAKIDQHLKEHGIPTTPAEMNERRRVRSRDLSAQIDFESALRNQQKIAKAKLSARFRRLNITHPQFPKKYRALFHQTREEYLANYRTANLSIPENVILELETLYGLVKELAFEERDLKYIAQANQILKNIIAANAINQQQNPLDITPEDVKELQNTQEKLTDQFKKEKRALTKLAEKPNA